MMWPNIARTNMWFRSNQGILTSSRYASLGVSPTRLFMTRNQLPRTNITLVLKSKSSLSNQLSFTRFRSNWYSGSNFSRTKWDRLKGPAIFTLLFCTGTTIAVPYITSLLPLRGHPEYAIYGLIGINLAVFMLWRLPNYSRLLSRYALLMKDNIYSNFSLVGSAFSHQSFAHLLVNMFVLQSFGTALCSIVGASNFLVMYLNSCAISSLASLAIPILSQTSLSFASLGASGAVFSVVGAFSYLLPKAPVAFFFIPVPGGAWLLFLGTVAWNIAGQALRWGTYDYAAHIGGSLVGILYGWYFTKLIEERRSGRRSISRTIGRQF